MVVHVPALKLIELEFIKFILYQPVGSYIVHGHEMTVNVGTFRTRLYLEKITLVLW
jgi:hypothetical protein